MIERSIIGTILYWIDEIKEKHYKKKHPEETYENVYNLIESVKWHLDKIQKDVKLMAKNEQAIDKTEEIEGVFDISADGAKEDFSKLGTKYIYYNKKTMKYTVQKIINNHKYYLGSFDTLEDAQNARNKFLREHRKGV